MDTGSPKFRRCRVASARERARRRPSKTSVKPSMDGLRPLGLTDSRSPTNPSTPRWFAFEQAPCHFRARPRSNSGAVRLRPGSSKRKPHDHGADRPDDDVDRSRPSRTGSRNAARDPASGRHHTTTACRIAVRQHRVRKSACVPEIVELRPLTNHDRAGADDEDVLDFGSLRHTIYCARALEAALRCNEDHDDHDCGDDKYRRRFPKRSTLFLRTTHRQVPFLNNCSNHVG